MKMIAEKKTAILLTLTLAVTFTPVLGQTAYAENDIYTEKTVSDEQKPDGAQPVKKTDEKTTASDKDDAIIITVGSSVSGTATPDETWYKFKTPGTSKQLYYVELINREENEEDMTIYVSSQKGLSIGVERGYRDGEIIKLAGNTWYYFKVFTWKIIGGGIYPKYTLSVNKLYNISKRVYLGSKKAQKLSAGNNRWYKFKTKSSSPYYKITIAKKNGGSIWYSGPNSIGDYGDTYMYGGIYGTEVYKEELPTKKWIYLQIKNQNESTASYSVLIKKIKDNGGESIKKAKKIGIGKQKGDICMPFDKDYFKFKVPASGTYKFFLFSPDRCDEYVEMRFLNAYGNEISNYSLGSYFTSVGISRDNRVTWSNLKKGKTYYIKIDTFMPSTHVISYSFRIKYILKKTSIKSLKGKHKGFVVKWKKRSKASGYCIKYSRKSNFSNSKTVIVKGKNETIKRIRHLKSGKKYYIKVRTYKIIKGKKYYSGWSEKKIVRTK